MQLHCESFPAESPGQHGVVLLHGLGSRGEDWLLQVPALRSEFSVLTVDLPGHGNTPLGSGPLTIPAMAEGVFRTAEGVLEGPFHVVGLSLGGLVGLQLALDFPAHLLSLVVVNAFARLRFRWSQLHKGVIRFALASIGPKRWLGRWIAHGLFPRGDQAQLREMAAARIAAMDRRAYLGAVQAVTGFDVSQRLGEIKRPTLIIAGERDGTVPLAWKRELQQGIRGSQMGVIPDSGHATPIDAHGAFNRILLDHLRWVERGSTGGMAHRFKMASQ